MPQTERIFLNVTSLGIYTDDKDNASLDDQLLFGQCFEVKKTKAERLYGYPLSPLTGKRGNPGYIWPAHADMIEHLNPPTMSVAALSAPVFSQPNIKSPIKTHLSFGSRLWAKAAEGEFYGCQIGFMHRSHIMAMTDRPEDWVACAELYMHLPYVWGGRSHQGVDCSGLVQNALWAAKIDCPRNSGEQEAALGTALDISSDLPALMRGDLVFWKGHVGIMLDAQTLLHANAHHMMTAKEPLAQAKARIAETSGPITAIKRLEL